MVYGGSGRSFNSFSGFLHREDGSTVKIFANTVRGKRRGRIGWWIVRIGTRIMYKYTETVINERRNV